MLRSVLVIGVAYVVLVVLAYLAQKKLLYFPDHPSFQNLASSASYFGLELWPAQDADYSGLISRVPRSDYVGTMIIFHGNAGSARDRLYYIEPLERLGYRIILAEYPGYEARAGHPRQTDTTPLRFSQKPQKKCEFFPTPGTTPGQQIPMKLGRQRSWISL